MREHELAGRAVAQLERLARLRIDQLGVDEAARAEVHSRLRLALTPERRADVADSHRLRHAGAPAVLERRSERGLAAAGLAGDEDSPDARIAQVGELEEVRGVRRRQHDRVGTQLLDREQRALARACAGRDMTDADPRKCVECGSGDERARVVRGEDAVAARETGRRVAARGAGHPVVEVAFGERDVARRAGRAARRVDADELGRRCAEMRADRIVSPARRTQLVLLGQRQLRDLR